MLRNVSTSWARINQAEFLAPSVPISKLGKLTLKRGFSFLGRQPTCFDCLRKQRNPTFLKPVRQTLPNQPNGLRLPLGVVPFKFPKSCKSPVNRVDVPSHAIGVSLLQGALQVEQHVQQARVPQVAPTFRGHPIRQVGQVDCQFLQLNEIIQRVRGRVEQVPWNVHRHAGDVRLGIWHSLRVRKNRLKWFHEMGRHDAQKRPATQEVLNLGID